jgi:conflict system STAND superfamily ATPase/TIR domain-containing protein
MEFDLFVVYAVADRDFVHGYLLPALNLDRSRVQLVDELTLGASLITEVERVVSHSRFTVPVLSAAYLVDRWAVFGEQIASYASIGDGRVIPLFLAACAPPLHLEALVSLDFMDRGRWATEAARLRALLQTTAPIAEQIPCPYPGMRPFSASEASQFFGREKEIDDLIGRLDHHEREIYVIGPSGSGKSSLVQAGLLPALDSGSSRLGRAFVVRAMRPGEQPSDRLAHALEGSLATLEATVGALLARHPPAERALVFIDQLEELFTLTDPAERQRFITILRMLRAEPQCYLLFALRADLYGALMESALWPDLAGRMSRVEIAPLRGAALVQAITTPVSRVGVYMEARLCDRLVMDAADEPGALPHVQETLRLLWDKRRHRFLGLADYEALGDGASGLHMAIARHADATIRTLGIAQQTHAYRLLLRLVSFGEGRADTRRQQKVQALRSAADDDAEFRHVLRRLVDERLVTVDGDRELTIRSRTCRTKRSSRRGLSSRNGSHRGDSTNNGDGGSRQGSGSGSSAGGATGACSTL